MGGFYAPVKAQNASLGWGFTPEGQAHASSRPCFGDRN
jgi:hypothetical protein